MMTSGKTLAQSLAAIEALDLEPIKFKAMRPDDEDGYGWSAQKAQQAALNYKKYLILRAKHPATTLVPDQDTDKFWHLHILDTRKYAADCQTIFGEFMHHFPYYGLRGEDDARAASDAFAETRRLLAAEFGEGATRAKSWCAVEEKKAAWCAAAEGEVKAAWCAAAEGEVKAAWCAAAEGEVKAAWCAAAEGEVKAAWCAAAEGEVKAAWCAAAEGEVKAAWCAAAEGEVKAAWCAAAEGEVKAAWCAVEGDKQAAWCAAEGKPQAAWCAAEGAVKAAWCAVEGDKKAAWCAVAGKPQAAWCAAEGETARQAEAVAA